jgi:hypothetical protein
MYNRCYLNFLFISLITVNSYGQQNNDSLLQKILNDRASSGDQGVLLLKSGQYEAATEFLSNQIQKEESNRQAYFRRGVANWAQSDTLNACRDWSSVLALGDTEMFNLLDSRCHGSMIISNDTIPKKTYHRMWAKSKENPQETKTFAEVSPSFPGGEEKLFEYIRDHLDKPDGNLHGTVYVNFLISPRGEILYPYVTHGIGEYQDKEAVRLVRYMPKWNAGKQKGKPVYMRSNLPVRF